MNERPVATYFFTTSTQNTYEQLVSRLKKEFFSRSYQEIIPKRLPGLVAYTPEEVLIAKTCAKGTLAEFRETIGKFSYQSSKIADLLWRAATSESDAREKLKYLLGLNLDINQSMVEHHNNTAMHLLLVNEEFDIAQNFLELAEQANKFIDVSKTDSEGKDIIITAVRMLAPTKLIASLIASQKNKVDLQKEDNKNKTALFYACLLGQVETAKLLLENGADPLTAREAFNSTLEEIATTLMEVEIHPLRSQGHKRNKMGELTFEGKPLLANKEIIKDAYNQIISTINSLASKFVLSTYEKNPIISALFKQWISNFKSSDIESANIMFTHITKLMDCFELARSGQKQKIPEFFKNLGRDDLIPFFKLYVSCEAISGVIRVQDTSEIKNINSLIFEANEIFKTFTTKAKTLSNDTLLRASYQGFQELKEWFLSNYQSNYTVM